MEAGKFSFKFSRQTQKNLVGSSKYAYFSVSNSGIELSISKPGIIPICHDDPIPTNHQTSVSNSGIELSIPKPV
jgi:hypothetical protein